MNKNYVFGVIMLLLLGIGSVHADEITVNNGSSRNSFVPVYGQFANRYSKSQFIIPADSIQELAFNTITGLTFYSSYANISWGNAKFEVYMTEVDYTTFTSTTLVDWTTMSKVRNAASLSVVNNLMEVVFDTPYHYSGGNLLIGIRQTVQGSYHTLQWYGATATNASIGGYEYSRGFYPINFLPKTTIDYTQEEQPSCIKPWGFSTTDITPRTATLNWTSEADAWQISLNNDTLNLIEIAEKPYTLEGLSPETPYTLMIRTNCGEDGYSDWTTPINFTTPVACPMPTGLSVTLPEYDHTLSNLSWNGNGASLWQICLNNDTLNLIEATDSLYTLTGLIPETVYTVKVRAHCGTLDGTSRWSNTVTFEPTTKTVIGSGTGTNNNLPTNSYWNFAFTQQIYTVAELGPAGVIESIEFYNTSVGNTRNLGIYLVSTDKDCFASSADWVPVTEDDLVYSGTVVFLQNSWTSIPLNSFYQYDGMQNIVLVVDDNTGTYQSPAMSFRTFSAPDQALSFRSDYYDFDPSAPYEGTKTSVKNQIRLAKSSDACMKPSQFAAEHVTLNSALLDWHSDDEVWQVCLSGDEENPIEVTEKPYTMEGLLPDTEYTAKVRTLCGDNNHSDWAICSFTTLSLCEVPTLLDTVELSENCVNLSWEGVQDNYNLRYGVDEPIITDTDFEEGVIPSTWNNDSFYPWAVVYDTLRNTYYIMSGNQGISDSESVISFTATYLADGIIEFDGNCWGEGLYTYWDHCDFYIDDTRLLYVGANLTEWGHYIFEVTAGVHTFTWSYTKDNTVNPTGDFFAVDNIVMSYSNYIWAPTIEEIADTTYNLTGLTPNTTYYVQVQGIQSACDEGVTEWSEMMSFTTPVSQTINQTITLGAGWNLCSFYVNITLDDLKAALVNLPGSRITIKSQTSSTTYNGVRWMGTLNQLDVAQTYKIKVIFDCEITLEGAPINPAELPIMISHGNNYIAFPFEESMTLGVAFSGFAVSGDKVLSQTGSAFFNGTEWRGSLHYLTPGQGYIYKSNVQEDRIFTYPTRLISP